MDRLETGLVLAIAPSGDVADVLGVEVTGTSLGI